METKTYRQLGTFTITILGAVALLIAIGSISSIRSSGPGIPIILTVLAILVVCLLLFYRLTIILGQSKISFKMGIGIIGKSYRFSDIKSCTPVRNSFFMGVGIHWIGNGWLYNVTGFKAIELRFYNKKSVVRIGTDRPEEISELIRDRIHKNVVYEPLKERNESVITPFRIFLLIAALSIVGLIVYNNGETRVEIADNTLIIKGMYGMSIPLNSIRGVDTLSVLPTNEKLSGYTFAGTEIGNFRLSDHSRVKFFVKSGHPPFIRIWIKDTVPVYINFRDRQKTIEVYRQLLKTFEK